MKNYLIILLLSFYSFSNAQVQTGLKAGLSLADIQGNSSSNNAYSSTQAFYGGIFFNFHFNGFLQLQTEMNFSPQGGQKTSVISVSPEQYKNVPPGSQPYARLKTTIVLNYLEFPVLAKMTFGRKLKYSVLMGPYIGVLLSAKKTISGNSQLYSDASGTVPLINDGIVSSIVSFNSLTNIYSKIKTINPGIQGGMSLQYPAGPGFVFLEWRTIIGAGNIQVNRTDSRMGTSCLVFSSGYFIKL